MTDAAATRRAHWCVTGPNGQHSVDFGRNVHALLGLPFDAVSLDEATRQVVAACLARRPLFLSTPNVNFVVTASRDAAFRHSVLVSDLSVADGMPLVWLARWLGIPIRERVAGADVFERLRSTKTPRLLRVYFFGGPEGVAEQASARVGGPGRSTLGVGGQSPGFHPLDVLSTPDRLGAINRAAPDLLLVALGAQKGQAWIMRNRVALLDAPVVSHLGAVVNFVAGTVQRAPSWVARTGLEWFWRIAQEPGLWRRYWNDGLALANLVRCLALPVRAYVRASRGRSGLVEAGRWSLQASAGASELTLAGDLRSPHLDELRDALSEAARRPGDLEVRFGRSAVIDSAGFGLLLLLQGLCGEQDRRLTVEAEDANLAKALSAHGLVSRAAFKCA